MKGKKNKTRIHLIMNCLIMMIKQNRQRSRPEQNNFLPGDKRLWPLSITLASNISNIFSKLFFFCCSFESCAKRERKKKIRNEMETKLCAIELKWNQRATYIIALKLKHMLHAYKYLYNFLCLSVWYGDEIDGGIRSAAHKRKQIT